MTYKDGFYYPLISKDKCIDCKRCLRACQYNGEISNVHEKQSIYAAWNNKDEILSNSTSGGIFTAVAEAVLEKGGVVFGSVYDKLWNVITVYAEAREPLSPMRGSKYAMGSTAETFKEVREFLKSGRVVFYTGTPCQIQGLKCFLGKEYDNLYTADLICHGAPSAEMLKGYVKYLEQSNSKKVSSLFFRYKKDSWLSPYVKIVFTDGSTLLEKYRDENIYADAFGFNIALSPACNKCLHCNMERPGDITMGDFWHLENEPEMCNVLGTSLFFVNTDKGRDLLKMAGTDVTVISASKEQALKSNPQLSHPAASNPLQKSFIKCLRNKGFKVAYTRYVRFGKLLLLPYRILRKLGLIH